MEAFEDDDFGELYAGVQVPNATSDFYSRPEPCEEEQPDANSNRSKLNEGKNDVDEEGCGAKELNGGGDYACSDSDDDDLNILLNDDDCADFPAVGVVGCDDEDGDGDDHLDNRSELVTKNGVKGGYGSRFFHPKYMTARGLTFMNNMKANMSMGMASYCSSLNKGGRWNGEASIQNLASSSCHATRMCAAPNPMGVQCGYGSFLPWYWSIFDVNIDTLKEKPWRVPGVDITDYFNFGFNENTWKLYCTSLEQLWQTSMQTGIPVDEFAKLNQEVMGDQIDQIASGSVLSPSSDCELPKGRPIQVEDSMVERQPSMDVRRPPSRDSDVIIQIKVLESSDDGSGSGNSIVMDASLEGESILGNKRNIVDSSSERGDVLSEYHVEDVKRSEDSTVQQRNDPTLGVDEDKHQDQPDHHSEDTADVPGVEIKAEEGDGIGTCNADSCWIESELSLGDQELSLTSYPDSDSEATGNSVHVDTEKTHTPSRRQSVDSVADLKDSLPLYCKNSKNDSFNRKPVNVDYYSRNRGPSRKQWRHRRGKHDPGSNLNKHVENDNDVSSILMSSARDLSLLGHQFVDYDKHTERRQDFGSRKRRGVLYNRETKQDCYYGGEKVVDNRVQTMQTKYSYREDRESFRENMNRYGRKNGYERDYLFESRSPMVDDEDRERDWYHAVWGYSVDELSPQSFPESIPKNSSFPAEERDTQRSRINGISQFRDGNFNNDFDKYEFEFLNKSYRVSISSAEREMEYLGNDHEDPFPHIDRDWKRSAQSSRHRDRPPLVLDNLWSGKMEDKCLRNTHHQTSNFRYRRQSCTDSGGNYMYGTRVNEKFRNCRRNKHARYHRGNDWSCGYIDAAEDEDYQFYMSPSEVLNWTEDEIIFRHHETHAASLHAKVQIDDIKLQQHRLSMPRRGGENGLKGSSKILCRGKRRQAVLRCNKSVDLVSGEGKSHTRSSRVLCHGRLENVDQGIAKKRRALVDFDESHNAAIKFNTSRYKSNHENKKLLQNLPDKQGQKESSDIEEGQIVTEETCIEASVSRRDVSEGAALTDSVKKKRMSQNENHSNQLIGSFDSRRILDSLAKMEKRRERFKQPITMKKEAEESLKLNNDSMVDTGEMKQHRPARKRRWVCS